MLFRSIKSKRFPFAEQGDNLNAFLDHNHLVVKTSDHEFEVDHISLEGKHNMLNSMAASLSADILNIKKEEIKEALADFQGVEHRMESVKSVKGVQYINDSKATNVNSCWYALQCMTQPTVLIIGGKDKGNDYTEIEQLVKDKCKSLIFLGVDNSKLIKFFSHLEKPWAEAKSMDEAVKIASEMAKDGDTVLLSRCSASFDLFKSYEDRGTQFKECVQKI